MGLDWEIVNDDSWKGTSRNASDLLGARRASLDDSLVLHLMGEHWRADGGGTSFEDFVAAEVSKRPPPIVLTYGLEGLEAMPLIEASMQYYGYRAEALRPRNNWVNRISARHGHDWEWLTDEAIDASRAIDLLTTAVELCRQVSPQRTTYYEASYRTERQRRIETQRRVIAMAPMHGEDAAPSLDAAQSFDWELAASLGAIDWLRFWRDKGLVIAASW